MILFTVGTHEDPFDRLVQAAEVVAVALGERVVVQRGYSSCTAPHCEVLDLVSPSVFRQRVSEARLVVTHAGPATIDLALFLHKPVIVVPRSPAHGEHVDDHQLRFARYLERWLPVVWDPQGLPARIAQAAVESAPATFVLGWSNRESDELADSFLALLTDAMRPAGQEPPARANLWSVSVGWRRIVHSLWRSGL